MNSNLGLYTAELSTEVLLNYLLQSLAVPTCIFTGPDFIITLANKAILQVWGKDERVIGSPINEVDYGLSVQLNMDLLKKMYSGVGTLQDHVVEIGGEVDGEVRSFYYRYTYKTLINDEQQIFGILASAVNITEKVLMDQKAEVFEQKFKHRILHSAMPIGIFNGPDYTIEIANEKMLDFWGLNGSDVIGKSFWECLPHLKPIIEPLLNDTNATGKIVELKDEECKLFRNKTLKTIFINFGYQPVHEAGDKHSGIMAIAVDITNDVLSHKGSEQTKEENESLEEEITANNEELYQMQHDGRTPNIASENRVTERISELENKQAEAETERKRLYRLIMDAPTSICILSGPDLVYELINPLYQNLFPGRELLGKPILEAIPEMAGQPIHDILKNVYLQGETFEGRDLLIPLAAEDSVEMEDRYFSFVYQARFDAYDRIDGVIVFANDVTQEVSARKLIEENEKTFRQVLESMLQLCWTNSPEGEVLFYNKRWYDYTGLSHEQTRDGGWKAVVHPDDLDHTMKSYLWALETGHDFEVENRYRQHDGTYRWYLARAVAIRDDQDKITMWVGTATEINEIKLMQYQREEFISIASHELKTPITSLSASMQILNRVIKKEGETPKIITQMVESSINHLNKVMKLVNELLCSTVIEQGQLNLNKTWVTVSELVDGCCDYVRLAGIFNLRTEGDLNLRFFADEHKLDQVLVNLVNNAIKYAPESKEVIILIEKLNDDAKISVQDFGPGIPPDKLSHLFDRFFRADESGSQSSGLGLGLYVCQKIIEKHGGEVGVTSELGVGSTFWFTIPLK